MGKSQKKRLLAASERFRRDYFHFFYNQKVWPDGSITMNMHIENRIPFHKRLWKKK